MGKPKIRFKGYTDDWEQRKVGDLVKDGIIDAPLDGNHGEKHPTASEYVDLGIPFLMASDVHNGIVNIKSCKFITSERAKRLDKGFTKNGDVLLTHKATIGESAILQGLETEYAVLTPQVTYYRIQDEERLSREYLYAFFNSVKFQNDLRTKAMQSTRPYIGISAQQDLDIVLPRKLMEQKKIGVYFFNLDHLITLHQRKCEETKKLKKYMLQKMFPQNGQVVPEIRFSGFTDDWEQRKLGEYVSITSGEAPSKFEVGTELYVKVDDLNYNDKYVVDTQNKVAEHSTVKRVTKGSVVFPKRGAAIMTNKVRIMGIDGYMDTNMMALTSEKLDSEFLYNIISKEGLYKIADTSTIPQINNKHVEPYEVTIPSLDEQRKIGAYFKQLDHLITLHQNKCDELKKIKKFMLQNMFV